MFDAPLDAWYVWLGLSAASVAVFGVVVSLPVAPVPDAPAVAETIDHVSVTEYDTTASRTLDADAIRIEPRRVGLRNDAGTTHVTLAYPVVPVVSGSRLAPLLRGTPPAAVFASPTAFDHTVTEATRREPTWTPANARLVVRHLSWGPVDVTLVGTTGGRPGRLHTGEATGTPETSGPTETTETPWQTGSVRPVRSDGGER
jgi:hypothetical protein